MLGAVLIDNQLIAELVARLRPEDFYRPLHHWTYRAMEALYDARKPIDYVTVIDKLKELRLGYEALTAFKRALETPWEETGIEYMAELAERVPTSANGAWYAEKVRSCAILRETITAGMEIVGDARDHAGDLSDFLDHVEQKVFAITQRDVGQTGLESVSAVMKQVFEKLDQAHENAGLAGGILTPFSEINALGAQPHPGEVTILAARPSMGKTSLALRLAHEWSVINGIPGAFASKEMGSAQLVQNMLCLAAKIDSRRLRTGYLDEYEYDRLQAAAERIDKAPLYLDASPIMTCRQVCATLRRAYAQKGIKYAIVDYLQLLDRPMGRGDQNSSREQQIGADSRALKALARELDIPVIVLAQLNRDVEKRTGSHRPRMSDLRESGSIEQDADTIWLLHREHYYTRNAEDYDKAEIIVAKQRNGPTGTARLSFRPEWMRFGDYEPEEQTQREEHEAEVITVPNRRIGMFPAAPAAGDAAFDHDVPPTLA